MKKVRIIAAAFSILAFAWCANAQSDENTEVQKEIRVEIVDGEHVLTITTTENGISTTEVYKGKEAEAKIAEMHGHHTGKGHLEEEEVIIHKICSGDKSASSEDAPNEETIVIIKSNEEENDGKHPKKMEIRTNAEGPGSHKIIMRTNCENLSEHYKKKLHEMMEQNTDVNVDEGEGKITIISDGETKVIDLKEAKDGEMLFISKEGKVHEMGEKGKRTELIIIQKHVVAEEDHTLESDLEIENFEVFPNPNDGRFTLTFDLDSKKKTTVQVTDLQGRVLFFDEVKKSDGHFTSPVDLSNEPKGVYLIHVIQGKKKTTRKVHVQ